MAIEQISMSTKKVGRPEIIIDPKKVAVLAESGLFNKQIAAVLGISEVTFCKKISADPCLKEALEAGRQRGIAFVTNKLWEKIKEGDLAAITFFLKFRGGWKDQGSLKIGGSNNQVLVIQGKPINELSRQELLEIARMEPENDETD